MLVLMASGARKHVGGLLLVLGNSLDALWDFCRFSRRSPGPILEFLLLRTVKYFPAGSLEIPLPPFLVVPGKRNPPGHVQDRLPTVWMQGARRGRDKGKGVPPASFNLEAR